MIDERPEIVNEKNRIGDWEIDSIIGKNHKQAVLSVVERASKFTLLKKLNAKTGDNVKIALTEALSSYKKYVYTITSDKRGLNENTNGLVRQYLKKGTEFTDVTDETLAIIASKLNNRPRKRLKYKTPNEVFNAK